METDEDLAMKSLVVSALAYYGLKVFHVFDGREFKACLKTIEIDKQKALEEFTEAVNATTFEIVEKFARECCRTDASLSTPPAAQSRELRSQLVPEPVLRLVAPALAEQGKWHSNSDSSRIWATLSTFVKDNSGHYVAPHSDGKCVNVEKKVNDGVQLQWSLQVAKAETRTANMVQNTSFNRPSVGGTFILRYPPAEIRTGNMVQNTSFSGPPAVGASFLPYSSAQIGHGNVVHNTSFNCPPATGASFLFYPPTQIGNGSVVQNTSFSRPTAAGASLPYPPAEIGTGNVVQNTSFNRPPAAGASLLPYPPAQIGSGNVVRNTSFNRPPAGGASLLPYPPAQIGNGNVVQNTSYNRLPAGGGSFRPCPLVEIGTGNLVQNPTFNHPPAPGASFRPYPLAEIGTEKVVQNTHVNRPAAGAYSPTKNYSSLRRDGGQQSPMRKEDAVHNEELEHCEAKRLRPESNGEGIEKTHCTGVLQEESEHCDAKRSKVESVGEEIDKEKEPGRWRENLAKEWPHIFQEIEEHVSTDTKQTDMEERSKCAYSPSDVPTLIEVEMGDFNNIHESPYVGRKRKRERATDEKESGGTVLNDSSLESIGRLKDPMNHVEGLEGDSTICPGDEEQNVESEVGSSRTTLEADVEVTEQKQNKTSWPAPLYGDQTRAKSCLQGFEHPVEGDICADELQVEEDICAHELQGDALDTCPVCRRKEEIAFAKYTRLFKDDPTWTQKFLDGENLTCDICSSKGKATTFSDVALLLSHARKGLQLRGPEHRGYAKAIYSLMQLSEPGNIRTCHSAVGETTPNKTKRVWPPVIVLENTFNASDRCSDLKDLDKEVTRRLKAFVNVEELTVHKVRVNGFFQGTILVQFPPTQRGSNDANRLNQHFLLTGRSLQEWMRVRNKPLALTLCAPGEQEICDLVKIGESGEIRSRMYYGYLATIKIMTRLDPRRQYVKWRVREGQIM